MALACRTSSAPQARPAEHRDHREDPQTSPATPWSLARTSAAMPVRVMVSTVVVRSGTARRRATAFWIPMASASGRRCRPGPRAVEAGRYRQDQRAGHQDQFGRRAGPQQQAAVVAQPAGQRTAEQAPTRKPASAANEALSENPGAPTKAKPLKTTFPVMLATNTRPRLRC